MFLFVTFLKRSFLERYAYRFDFYTSIFGSFISLFVQLNVWSVLMENNSSNSQVSLDEMLTYVIITSLITALTASQVGEKIAQKVDNGSIISDFIRPINIRNYLWAEDIGKNIFNFLLINIPNVIIILLFMRIEIVFELSNFLMFLISLVLAIIIAFYIQFVLGLLAFWLQTPWYISWILNACKDLFSGSVIPLWFYPDWLYQISSWLPFRLIIFEPINMYLGNLSIDEGYKILLLQCVWIVSLYLLSKLIWSKAQSKIIVHGG
ncbi:ABC-2 family transporter protein [Paenibacillus sp. JNUCC31]|uniref:ABC transporter permease n=1 Tax=Paenibacillus sp. JNUCC-31 TaxID=2777983 RepID=UPI00177ADA67|nr:ABC-2 family transporter protein [Paenibacillus sp. JNUCC-31]QOS76719.1 ABC-2 family transporter protein [Paenibacillus sp. JNUCC-31]